MSIETLDRYWTFVKETTDGGLVGFTETLEDANRVVEQHERSTISQYVKLRDSGVNKPDNG